MVGVVLVAVAIVVGLVTFQLRSNNEATDSTALASRAASATVLAKGVQQSGNAFGSPSAPYHVTEYVDFKCPYCAEASRNIVPPLVSLYVRTGKVQLELRPIRIPDGQGGARLGGDTERGAFGAIAAGRQNKMLSYAETLFAMQQDENTAWVTEPLVTQIAQAVGLDMGRWQADYAAASTVDALYANEQAATADRFDATPFFVIRGPHGRVVTSENQSFQRFVATMQKVAGSDIRSGID